MLWPDYDRSKAFTNLRQTLWEIQQSIDEGWLITERERIGLNEDAEIWLDVRKFESLLAEGHSQTDISLRIPLFLESTKLYRNHFLARFSLKHAPIFKEWAFGKSEDLRCQLAGVLTSLSEDYCALGLSKFIAVCPPGQFCFADVNNKMFRGHGRISSMLCFRSRE